MSRPAPRKSSLAGSTPAAPPAIPNPANAPEPAVHPEPAPTTPVTVAPRKPRPKVSFYQDSQDTARARAALLHTQTLEGARSLSDFINRAVMTEVERLEVRYNGGQSWAPIGAHELPQGRPMGT